MKVIKHWKYGAPPEKPIFTHPLPVFGVDRQTDRQTYGLFIPKRNSQKVTIYKGPVTHACNFSRGPSDGRGWRTLQWPYHFCCTRLLCLLCSFSQLSRCRWSHWLLTDWEVMAPKSGGGSQGLSFPTSLSSFPMQRTLMVPVGRQETPTWRAGQS